MKHGYPNILFYSETSLDEIKNIVSLINQNIAETTETVSLTDELKVLGQACLEYNRFNNEAIVSENIKSEIKETTHQILLASSPDEKFKLEYLQNICDVSPQASEFFIMYPEKFKSSSNEAAFITRHIPEDTLKQPKISISGECMTGQPVLDIVPQAQKIQNDVIVKVGLWVCSADEMLSKIEDISDLHQKNIYKNFVLIAKEELQKNPVKIYEPIF